MGMSPPWQTSELWQAANEALADTIQRYKADLQQPREIAGKIFKRIEKLDDLMDSLCALSCPGCRDSCCHRASPWYDFKDLLYIHLAMVMLPPGQIFGSKGHICRYITPSGCALPRVRRPFICTWYLCTLQKKCLQRMAASKAQFLFNSLTALKTGRNQLENQFVRIVTTGKNHGNE